MHRQQRAEVPRGPSRRRAWTRRRLVARAHGLAGALAALPLLLVALTGVALVFSEEMLAAGAGEVRAPGRPLTTEEAARALEGALAALGSGEKGEPAAVATLRLPRADFGLARAWLTDGTHALVDTSAARVVRRFAWHQHPATFLHELHVALTLGGAGEQIVGGIGLVGVALLGSGGFALWRRRKTLLVGAFWRPRSTRRGELARVHAHWGLALLPLALLALLTGLGLTYHGVARAVLTTLAGGKATASAPPETGTCAGTAQNLPPSAMADVAGQRFPEAELVMVYPPRGPRQPWGFRMRQPGEWHPNGRTMAWIDACDGTLVAVEDARAAPLGERFVHAIYPLHAARFPGALDEVLVVLTGTGFAIVVAAGAAGRLRSFVPRRARKKTK
jgi:uncharacterized iron-regulated membrane protein